MCELTRLAKDAINLEMSKIWAIEEFLVKNGVLKNDVKDYAIAIYSNRKDVSFITCEEK